MHLLSLMLAASAACVSADVSQPQSDKEKLQGTWVVEKQDWGKWGNAVKEALPQVTKLEITDDTCVVVSRESSTDPEERNKVTLILDDKETPAKMDFESDGKKTMIKMIYKIDKAGLLTIAFGVEDKYRPKGFDPSKERILVLVLKKKMKADK